MKKYLLSALILAAMVGCQNENDILEVQNKSNLEFSASLEESDGTRTALNSENKVVWLTEDLLSVFGASSANLQFILKDGANSTFGTFKPNEASGGSESDGGSATLLSANAAYYPYDKNVSITESNGSFTFNANFPAEQTYSESGTFGDGASPMVAVTKSDADATFMFKNVGGILKLRLTGSAKITQIKLEGTNGQKLAGNYSFTTTHTEVATESYNPTLTTTNGVSAITLDCGEGVPLSNSETVFVFAMLPVEFGADELKITIYDDAGKKMTYTHANAFSLGRSESKYITTQYSGDETAITTEASLKSALSQATSSDPIVVEDDITLEEPLNIESTNNVNLDLDGNTLILGESAARSLSEYGIKNQGTLKFSNGAIEYTGNTAIINEGVLEFENVDLTASYVAVKNIGVWATGMTVQQYKGTEAKVKFTMNGGSITSTTDDVSKNVYAIMAVDYSMTSIKDATIKGTKSAGGLHLNCAEANLDNVTIIRGTSGTAHQVCVVAGVLTTTNTAIDNHRYYYGDSKGTYGYAEVNGVYYGEVNQAIATDETSLTTALANLADGATVKLFNDISVKNQLTYNKASKSLVLDLNEKTLTLNTTYGLVNKAGKLTIKNGDITGNCSYTSLCNWAGSAAIETVLDNVDVTASYIGMYSKGVWADDMTVQKYKGTDAQVKFTMNGGSITSTTDDVSKNVYAIMSVDYSLTSIKNATIKGTNSAGGLHLNCAEAKLDNVTITRGTSGTAHQVFLVAGVLTTNNTAIDNYRYYYGDSKGKNGYAEVDGTYYGEVNTEVAASVVTGN